MNKVFLLLVLTLLSSVSTFAQIKATTKEGKEVVLNEDGTWKYVNNESSNKSGLKCEDVIIVKTDKMTDKLVIKSKEKLKLDDNKDTKMISVFMMKQSNMICFLFGAVGGKNCIAADGELIVLFRNGDRISLDNNGVRNCTGDFMVYLGGGTGGISTIKKLATQEIETIRITTTTGYVQEELKPEQSQIIMKTVQCLAKQRG